MEKIIRYCKQCANPFEPTRLWSLYCSDNCRNTYNNNLKKFPPDKRKRFCKNCGKEFLYEPHQRAKQHCSDKCSAISARLTRTKFYKEHPANVKEYREKQNRKKIGNLDRLYGRYPGLPRQCQSCGETRVLDVAHKPNYKRNGAWRNHTNCTPEKIWILCPTCHALIDRKHYNPKELGLC